MKRHTKLRALMVFALGVLLFRTLWRIYGKGSLGWEVDAIVYIFFVVTSLVYLYQRYKNVEAGITPKRLMVTGVFSGIGIGLSTLMVIAAVGTAYHTKHTLQLLDIISDVTAINVQLFEKCGEACENIKR